MKTIHRTQPCPQVVQTGRLHSFETCGTVDGPGLRFVVFLQGCPLRCLYCHNADCREPTGGREVTVAEVLAEIERYRHYFKRGGVTVSGGEPLMQPEFARALLNGCREMGLHAALDTSGYAPLAVAKPVIAASDLVLLDIKSFDPQTYRNVTGVAIEPTLQLARYLSDIGKPTWIRFVLVPNLTDARQNVGDLADFIATLENIERVEVLPFHQMGAYKWEQLGYDYALKDTPPASPELTRWAIDCFRERGLPVVTA